MQRFISRLNDVHYIIQPTYITEIHYLYLNTFTRQATNMICVSSAILLFLFAHASRGGGGGDVGEVWLHLTTSYRPAVLQPSSPRGHTTRTALSF